MSDDSTKMKQEVQKFDPVTWFTHRYLVHGMCNDGTT